MGVLGVIAKRLDALIGPGIMLLFPLYASLRAIESPSVLDDQQWLTYWIIYSFITLFELSFYKILVWFPLWGYMKLLLCAWLVLPMFNGAAYIYEKHIRRYIVNNNIIGLGGRLVLSSSSSSAAYSEDQRKLLQMMTFDARKAVVQYVDKYGWESVERAIKAAERETKKH